jgi:[ribosomal protein S5]-alanine N-acetyltransferase
MTLTTRRLTLREASLAFLRAYVAGDREAAARLAGAVLPDDWPGTREAHEGLTWHLAAVEKDPRELPWRVRLVILDGVIVGSINLKGPPDEHGDVEIGWGLIPTVQRRGLATEAAQAVIEWAFRDRAVRRVIATIAPDHERSQQVALRLGMLPVAEIRRDLPVWALPRP